MHRVPASAALHAAEEDSLVCRVHPWQEIKLEIREGHAGRDERLERGDQESFHSLTLFILRHYFGTAMTLGCVQAARAEYRLIGTQSSLSYRLTSGHMQSKSTCVQTE